MRLCIIFLLLNLTINLNAQDRFFARTYTTNVLPKNGIDIEFWHTSRVGHEGNYFHRQDQRMEIEVGLGKNVQTAFYFNKFQKRYSDSESGTQSSSEIGISNEWKWKISDPSTDKIGFALYSEFEIKGGDEFEWESKLIFDKYFGNHLLAFNGIFEYEREFDWSSGKFITSAVEMPVELDFGYQYMFSPKFGVGFEIRNQNGITKNEGWKYSVICAGPTINYRDKRWFIIGNFMPQVTNIKKTEYAPNKLVLDDMERFEGRIIFGISF